MRPYAYLICLLPFLGSSLSAQNFRLNFEGGINGSGRQDLGYNIGVGAEYAVPINNKTSLVLGAEYQYLNYEKQPVVDKPWECLGDCVFNFTETETYRLRSFDAFLNVGLERQFGRWSTRLIAAPAYRMHGKVSAHLVVVPRLPGRPFIENNFTLKPGEQTMIENGSNFNAIDYEQYFYLQIGFEAAYTLTPQTSIGLAYRRTVTNYEVVYSTGGCGIASCFEGVHTRFDARMGTLLTTIRYSL